MSTEFRFVHFQGVTGLVIRQVDNTVSLLLPDNSVAVAQLPLASVQSGRSLEVFQLLRQVIFLPNEIAMCQQQAGKLLQHFADTQFTEEIGMEQVLRINLLPMLLITQSLKKPIRSEYSHALSAVISVYYQCIAEDQHNLMPYWEDVCALLNHVLEFAYNYSEIGTILNDAVNRGLVETILKLWKSLDVNLLLQIHVTDLKEEIVRLHLAEEMCVVLLSRTEIVTASSASVLRLADSFASESQIERVVQVSLEILRPVLALETLTVSQVQLCNQLVFRHTQLCAGENTLLDMLLKREDSKAAGGCLLSHLLVSGTHSVQDLIDRVGVDAVRYCLTGDTVGKLVTEQRWETLSFLKQIKHIDQHLHHNLKRMLECHAPASLLMTIEFSLTVSTFEYTVKNIRYAKASKSIRYRVLKKCLSDFTATGKQMSQVSHTLIQEIEFLGLLSFFLFMKSSTCFKRLPSVLIQEVFLDYLK